MHAIKKRKNGLITAICNSERLLCARFKHSAGYLSVVVAYAPTEIADIASKDQFYIQLEAAVADCKKNDLMVILGDFDAVTGTNRLQGDTVLGPWGSGFPNENSDLFLSFCRGQNLSIAGLWFQRKDIRHFSRSSNDGITWKEIDHMWQGGPSVQSSPQLRHRLFPVLVTLS